MRSENGERTSTVRPASTIRFPTDRSLSSSSPLPTTEASCSALCAGVSAHHISIDNYTLASLLGDSIVRPSRSSGAGRGTPLSPYRNCNVKVWLFTVQWRVGCRTRPAQHSTAQHSSIVRKGKGNTKWQSLPESGMEHRCLQRFQPRLLDFDPSNETSCCMVMYIPDLGADRTALSLCG